MSVRELKKEWNAMVADGKEAFADYSNARVAFGRKLAVAFAWVQVNGETLGETFDSFVRTVAELPADAKVSPDLYALRSVGRVAEIIGDIGDTRSDALSPLGKLLDRRDVEAATAIPAVYKEAAKRRNGSTRATRPDVLAAIEAAHPGLVGKRGPTASDSSDTAGSTNGTADAEKEAAEALKAVPEIIEACTLALGIRPSLTIALLKRGVKLAGKYGPAVAIVLRDADTVEACSAAWTAENEKVAAAKVAKAAEKEAAKVAAAAEALAAK